MTRSEQRRQQREEKKLDNKTGGFTNRHLKEAEAALIALSEKDRRVSDSETAFAVLLDQWRTDDSGREALVLLYQRTAELIERGRQVTNENVVVQYAQLVESLELIEDQMVQVLEHHDDTRIRTFLESRHMNPARGIYWSIPDDLQKRLADALGLDETLELQLDAEPAPTNHNSPEHSA